MTSIQPQLEGLAYPSLKDRQARRYGRKPTRIPVEQRWAEAARRTIEEFETADFGERNGLVTTLAASEDMKPSTLQNAIRAFRFVLSRKIKTVALSTFPIGVVDALLRWSEFDLASATEAAEQFAREDIDLETFFERAREARSAPSVSEPGFRTAAALRTQASDVARQAFSGYQPVQIGHAVAQSSLALVSPEGDERVAILVTGPYSDPRVELVKCREALQQALGLLMSYDKVVLACASDAAEAHARALLAEVQPGKALGLSKKKLLRHIDVWSLQARPAQVKPEAPATASEVEAQDATQETVGSETETVLSFETVAAGGQPSGVPAPRKAHAGRAGARGESGQSRRTGKAPSPSGQEKRAG